MKIVICDDSISDLIKIEKLLIKYRETYPNIKFEVEKFSDSSRLYDKIQKKELADIYILDLIMSTKTGIDLGKEIRRLGTENMIIYVTASDDFALEAYSVHAIRYLMKPVEEGKMFEALDYALSHLNMKGSASCVIKTKDGLVSVPYSRIEYIENSSRTLEVHLTNGESIKSIFIRKSFDEEIGEFVRDRSFLQVHKSFVINLKYVKKLARNSVFMESGEVIPVSQKRATAVKKEYLLFVSEYL